jgi:hypothetical protein
VIGSVVNDRDFNEDVEDERVQNFLFALKIRTAPVQRANGQTGFSFLVLKRPETEAKY